MSIIDADTHVIESESTWKYFETENSIAASRRPTLNRITDPQSNSPKNRWVIDGELVPKPAGRGGQSLATPPIRELESGDAGELLWQWRSLEDPVGRVEDAKKRGADHQVIYPTLFIAYLTNDPALEIALCRSYNRFMADAWTKSGELFSWIVVPPLQTINASIEELEFGKEHGATGVLFRGIEGERSLGDPYFDPIYAAASRLNLPICVHTGPGCPTLTAISNDQYMRNFGQVRILPLIAFHDIIHSRVPERHPELRFGFIEAASSWIPFLLHFLRRSSKRSKQDPALFGPALFERYRLYVACESDEDIEYISRFTGPDHLIIGTDYGHEDQSAELDLFTKLESNPSLDNELRRKILCDNAAALYGIELEKDH